jgi:hypothetical protein
LLSAVRAHRQVAREFVGRDIIPDVADLDGLGQQASEHVTQVLRRSGDVLVWMQASVRCRGARVDDVVLHPVVSEREACNSVSTCSSASPLVSDFSEMFEVVSNLTFVQAGQVCYDVGEVLVQRRTFDAGPGKPAKSGTG